MWRPVVDDHIETTVDEVKRYKLLGVKVARSINADMNHTIIQKIMRYHLKCCFARYWLNNDQVSALQYEADLSPAQRLDAMAYNIVRASLHLEVPEPAAGLSRGVLTRDYDDDTDTFTSLYLLEGKFAGHIIERLDGTLRIRVSAGWCMTTRESGSTHFITIDEGEKDYADEEERLAKEFRKVLVDPTLIWHHDTSPENIRKAKAKGWWQEIGKAKTEEPELF